MVFVLQFCLLSPHTLNYYPLHSSPLRLTIVTGSGSALTRAVAHRSLPVVAKKSRSCCSILTGVWLSSPKHIQTQKQHFSSVVCACCRVSVSSLIFFTFFHFIQHRSESEGRSFQPDAFAAHQFSLGWSWLQARWHAMKH